MRGRPEEEQGSDWPGPEGVPPGAGEELQQAEGISGSAHQPQDPTAVQNAAGAGCANTAVTGDARTHTHAQAHTRAHADTLTVS